MKFFNRKNFGIAHYSRNFFHCIKLMKLCIQKCTSKLAFFLSNKQIKWKRSKIAFFGILILVQAPRTEGRSFNRKKFYYKITVIHNYNRRKSIKIQLKNL